MDVYSEVKNRSGDRCEAMTMVKIRGSHTWTRCFRGPTQVHHMLTRSRGGLLLDAVGETTHLLALCALHHRAAHAAAGHDKGLLIDGYVSSREDGSPLYEGSHRLLSERYGPLAMSNLQHHVSRDIPSEGLRRSS